MRRILVVAGAAALLGAGAALGAVAPSTMKLTLVQVGSQKPNKTGFKVDDNDFRGTKRIGHDRLACNFAAAKGHCNVTFTLEKGTLRVLAVVAPNTNHGPLTVLGGTGAYAGATGTGTFRQLNKAGTRTAVRVSLT